MDDPQTVEEWQEAADAAKGALAFSAARGYGLVAGGPTINIDRCEDILARAERLGVTPRADAIERFVASLP